MWENLDPVWGTGSFEKFYNGPFKILLSTQPDDFDEWWDVNRECINFIDKNIMYISNPLYSITRDSTLNLNNVGSELNEFLKDKFESTSSLLIDPSVVRLCEDLSVELSLHQMEVFGFINMALMNPSIQNENGIINLDVLSSAVMELYYRELRFLLLLIHELANNCHPCVVLGVLCDQDSDCKNNISHSPSHTYPDENSNNVFTSQCPPICIYGCIKILQSGFIKNAVSSIFHSIQEIIKLGQANIKTEPQSMVDIPSNFEASGFLRDHYNNIIFQLVDTITMLFSRFNPQIDEVEALMELIPNVAKIHPSSLINRPTAADYDSWDNIKEDKSEKLTLSAKILFIVIISFDYIPQRWNRTNDITAFPNSLYDAMEWFFSSKRLPKASKQNLFLLKHCLISKLSQEVSKNDDSNSLSYSVKKIDMINNEFWDLETNLGKFAAFAINGAFGENSKKRFMGITYWKVFHYIQNDILRYLDPIDPVNLIFIQVIYDFYSISLNPTQDQIQWSRILQLQRRILMEKDSRQKVEKESSNITSKDSITSVLSPIICCLNVLCRRYPLASWGASKILSSCIETFPTLSMYSSYGETDQDTSLANSMPPILSELFIDLLDLAATIMMVGHYSLGQQIAHFLQNQPSNIWFHLPSIIHFITKTLSSKFSTNKNEERLLRLDNHSVNEQPKMGIWSGSGLDKPQFFHSFCRTVLRIISFGFSTRLNISHPPSPPLLNITINLQGGKSIANFITIVLRDWSENTVLEDPKLAYALQAGCLDAISNGLIHFQASETLEIIAQKIPVFKKTLQYSNSEDEKAIFLIKLLSCILTLNFKESNIKNIGYRNTVEFSAINKTLNIKENFSCNHQLYILKWILLDILPMLENRKIFSSVRYWIIVTLVLKYIRFILLSPLPDTSQEPSEESEAIIWLFRCILSIDSPTFHQLMSVIIIDDDPHTVFVQSQSSEPSNKFKIQAAKVGLDIIKILLQRDYLFIYWVQNYKYILNKQYVSSINSKSTQMDYNQLKMDTQAVGVISYTESALIPFHKQLYLQPRKTPLITYKDKYYIHFLLKYIISGIDKLTLKYLIFILLQLICRDSELILSLLTNLPSLLLQIRSTFTHILSNPDNDKFPVQIEKFVLENEDSFISIWNSGLSFFSSESDIGMKSRSLVFDQEAVFWEEITEADIQSSIYSCEYNLLGISCKSLLPIHNELELYWNLYLTASVESNDLSLWNKLKSQFKNSVTISSCKLDVLKANDIILNGYLQSISPTFITKRSCVYDKISRFHLTSTRSIVTFMLSKGIENDYIFSSKIKNDLDSVPSLIPLLLGLNLGFSIDSPTIKEYLLFSVSKTQRYSAKSYDEIYIPDPSSNSDQEAFPLLTIIDILSNPPQIPLSQPNEEKFILPNVDFAILTQLELYYISLKLIVNLIKIPQLVDFTLRLISIRFSTRYAILRERLLIPISWIPVEYRWMHYLHASMIINLISSEIFIVSQVYSAMRIIEDSEIKNSIFCDPFWVSSVQNLSVIFRIFLTSPKASVSVSDQFDILSIIINLGQAIIEDESNFKIDEFSEQISKQAYLFNSFIPYLSSNKNLVCGIFRTLSHQSYNVINNNKNLYTGRFSTILSNSIYNTCYHLFINEYIKFFGLLLNKFSSYSPLNKTEDSMDMETNMFFTLQSIIELCRPYINFSFFQKSPIPLPTAILSIFSQTFLTIVKIIYNFTSQTRNELCDDFTYGKLVSHYYISDLQKQKICFTTIQDCCEDIVNLLTGLEKASSDGTHSFPIEWKNTLLLLLSNCITIDSIQLNSGDGTQNVNESLTSSFLRHIWPEIWVNRKKNNTNNSTFIDFSSLLINNLRIPNKGHNYPIVTGLELESYLPLNMDITNFYWVFNPQDAALFSYTCDRTQELEHFERMSFYPDMIIGVNTKENHSFLSLYLLFLIYNRIYYSKQYLRLTDMSTLVPCSNGDEHIQNMQTLIRGSKCFGQSCVKNLILWNYITINWINMSQLFLRRIVESNYISYLLSQEVIALTFQDMLQFFSEFNIIKSEDSLEVHFNRIENHSELVISLFSLVIKIINNGIIPNNTLAGYGSIDNFEVIASWIEKLEFFFNSFFDFFIKHLLFCQQNKKLSYDFFLDRQAKNNSGKYNSGSQCMIERFSPILCTINSMFSKILHTSVLIINLNDKLNRDKMEYDDIMLKINSCLVNIKMLHSRCGQVLEVASQIISSNSNSNYIISILVSSVSWLESESSFLLLAQEKITHLITCGLNFKPTVPTTSSFNGDISNIFKFRSDIIAWLFSCINYLLMSLRDVFELKNLQVTNNKHIHDIIKVVTRSSVIILNYYHSQNLNKDSLINTRNTLSGDNFLDLVKNYINTLSIILDSHRKTKLANKMSEFYKICDPELEILRGIKFKLEKFVN
ncbi:hypothetical protein FG386_002060 [Cryptosporidium ryanae]|uniref:uncharacterized protein n=1 Tax=Cryptosporidium ryanae TaxID=515981 RepID=UPI00351A35E3|nr:hypothetical protein FG386_002060 [Cryptosporidium ryanae]